MQKTDTYIYMSLIDSAVQIIQDIYSLLTTCLAIYMIANCRVNAECSSSNFMDDKDPHKKEYCF